MKMVKSGLAGAMSSSSNSKRLTADGALALGGCIIKHFITPSSMLWFLKENIPPQRPAHLGLDLAAAVAPLYVHRYFLALHQRH